jgi:hypothetical protein
MHDRRPVGRLEERLVLFVPADTEVDVLTCTEHLDDLTPLGRPARKTIDLNEVSDTRG